MIDFPNTCITSARDRGEGERGAWEGASSDVITTCRLWSGAVVAEAHGARDGRRRDLRAFCLLVLGRRLLVVGCRCRTT